MKNKTGIIGGFVIGMGGFLLLFKLFFLDHISPADEIAPGVVVFVSLLSGALFAFIGQRIQNALATKRNT